MASYVERSKLEETVKVFKEYAYKVAELKKVEANDEKNVKKGKKKLSLLSVSDQDEESKYLQMAGFSGDSKIFVQATFKRCPSNKSTFINNFRSLPHPYHDLVDSTICLIVMDKAHKPLADRELDLRQTREYYQEKLMDAGLDEDTVKHRIYILPMRELLTEYRQPQMKRRLASSYDLFLADSRLIKNKFKLLPGFLGHKFWIDKKKLPIGICFKRPGAPLLQSYKRALRTAALYVTGHGPDVSLQFGVFKQPEEHLVDNLEFILRKINEKYGQNVQILKIKSTLSLAIPFYADLTRPTISVINQMPRTTISDKKVVIDEHPFASNAHLIVYPTGDTRVKKGWKGDDKKEQLCQRSLKALANIKKTDRAQGRKLFGSRNKMRKPKSNPKTYLKRQNLLRQRKKLDNANPQKKSPKQAKTK